MKFLKRKVCFIVLVLTLAGTLTTFISVHGTSTFDGTVYDCSDNPISGASVVLADCYFSILGTDTTDSSGDYSFGVTLNGNSPYYLTATKTRFNTGMEVVFGEGTNDFDLVGNGEKIAVFFWASDAGRSQDISKYIGYLRDYADYDTFYNFEDSENVIDDIYDIDDYEIDADTIFVYVIGHGKYVGGHSYTKFKPDGQNYSSDTFCDLLMNRWEANRKCILVESCYSEGWADDFAESPYLAMSTADSTHQAFTYEGEPTPYEGDFSHWFFEHVADGYNAVQSFNYACGEILEVQYPQKQDYSSYVWFD